MSYSKEEIAQGLAETYFYACHKCGQGNLSRDEVHARDHKYICLRCYEKSTVVDTPTDICTCPDCKERRLK